MKKTKKVISYIMLLVPLALPAGCSPVSTASVQGADHKKAQTDDDAEQLRLIVERYFAQQEQQKAAPVAQQLQAVTPQSAAQEPIEEEPGPALVESEEDLKEELEALKKTGDWKAENVAGGQAVQCELGAVKTAVIAEPDRPAVPLVDAPLPQPVETAAAAKLFKNKAATRGAGCFPMVVNRQVQFYLNLFQGKQRRNFSRWLERSSLYMPFITAELEKAGLPLELAYLAMIESGFNPSAYSRSHASGIWQFVPSTGRNFGLRVDSWADERRDPEKSTKAAAAYLKALYRQFGDWHLAVAAYNAGEGAVERGLKRYRVKNFWDLAQQDYLRLETKRYVPQMIAAALIANSPEQYGFRTIKRLRPVQYELVRVPSGTNLKAVAASASVSIDQLRSFNNDLLKDQAPNSRGGWLLKVPTGHSALVAASLPKAVQIAAAHPAVPSPSSEYTSHKVAKNETLQQISKKYGISMTALLKVNNLRSSQLKAGQLLRVPSSSGTEQLALVKSNKPSDQQLATAEKVASAEKITHKLKKGETLSDVGEKYHVQVAMLMKWNKLGKAGKVKAGQELTVYPAQETVQVAATAEVETSSSAGIVELTAAGTKQKPGAEAWVHHATPQKKAGAVIVLSGGKKQKAGKEDTVSYYKVRNGDSLWSISKKLQVSAKEIKDWNSLGDNAIQPGLTLMIKNG